MPQTWYVEDYQRIRDLLVSELGLDPEDHGPKHFTVCAGELTVHAEDLERGVMPSVYLVGQASDRASQAFKVLKKRFGVPQKAVRERTLQRMGRGE